MDKLITWCKVNNIPFSFSKFGYEVKMPDGTHMRRNGDGRHDIFLEDIKRYYEQTNTKSIKEK